MIACFDIGGSRVKAGLSDAPGAVARQSEETTPLHDLPAFVAVLRRLAGDAKSLSISIAGVVDAATGRLKVANIPCMNGREVTHDLSDALGRPVRVHNDADCFALAEAAMGAGRGHRSVFGVILGTGVGGGLVIDGRIVTGAGGFAGEWGHGPVLNERVVPWFPCGCGQEGCVDTIGGARGIERLHRHLTGRDAGSVAILRDWRAGEPDAARTVEVWLDLVSGPLAMVLNVVGSSVAPVGGGLSRVPELVAALDASVRDRVLRPTQGALLVPAGLVGEPGLVGASLAGWQDD